MNKGIIVVAIMFVMIIAVAIGVYFFYEKPIQDKPVELHDVNIRFYLESDINKQVETGYIISLIPLNNIYKEGKSLEMDWIREGTPLNNSFRVFNKNLPGQNYYTHYKEEKDFDGIKKSYRVEISLAEAGTLNIKTNDDFPVDNPINLIVESSGEVDNLGFCIRWSDNIISVRAKDTTLSEMSAPQRLTGFVDRCYDLKKSLINDSMIVALDYKKFGDIGPNDFIRVIAIDGDIRFNDPTKAVREEIDGTDVGIEDVVFIIK